MTKFLTLWELDTTKLPEKPEERISSFTKLLNMVKEDFKAHKTDWECFRVVMQDILLLKEQNRRLLWE